MCLIVKFDEHHGWRGEIGSCELGSPIERLSVKYLSPKRPVDPLAYVAVASGPRVRFFKISNSKKSRFEEFDGHDFCKGANKGVKALVFCLLLNIFLDFEIHFNSLKKSKIKKKVFKRKKYWQKFFSNEKKF